MPLNFKPLLKQKTNVFIETGTFTGTTLEKIKELYSEIHTIEIIEQFYNQTKEKYKNQKNITFHLGNSPMVLNDIIFDINEPITFWLDAHYQGAEQPNSTRKPLIDELRTIKKHPIKTHMIMIDDVRLFNTYGTTVDELKSELLEMNPNYIIEFDQGIIDDDVLIARI